MVAAHAANDIMRGMTGGPMKVRRAPLHLIEGGTAPSTTVVDFRRCSPVTMLPLLPMFRTGPMTKTKVKTNFTDILLVIIPLLLLTPLLL